PKGMGALYVRKKPRARVAAQIHGGGHEQGMRSGTLATHQIVAMGEAFAIAKQEMVDDQQRIQLLKNHFLKAIDYPGLVINGSTKSIPNIMNISFGELKSANVIAALSDLAISSGSACLSKGVEPSYVLRALGLTAEQAACGVRFSF